MCSARSTPTRKFRNQLCSNVLGRKWIRPTRSMSRCVMCRPLNLKVIFGHKWQITEAVNAEIWLMWILRRRDQWFRLGATRVWLGTILIIYNRFDFPVYNDAEVGAVREFQDSLVIAGDDDDDHDTSDSIKNHFITVCKRDLYAALLV